jgi:hypothetical protein
VQRSNFYGNLANFRLPVILATPNEEVMNEIATR